MRRKVTWFLALCAICLIAFGISGIHVQKMFKKEGPEKKKNWLLIAAYLRSGSTLTGNILQASDGVFYYFEPLYSLVENKNVSAMPLTFLDKEVRESGPLDFETRASRTVEEIWNCNFTNVDVATLSQFHLKTSPATRRYYYCMKKRGIRPCVNMLKNTCTTANTVMQKVVRLSLHLIVPLMEKYPYLKVIHLIRDPRASITSQSRKLKYFQLKKLKTYSQTYCERIYNDLSVTKTLAARYPDRIKLVRYETMADHPLQVAEDLYRFADLEFTEKIRQYIHENTYSGKRNSKCLVCTTKANATVAANMWRKVIGKEMAFTIDRQCLKVYELLGYLPVNTSQDLSDLSVSLWKRDVQFAGMNL